MIVEIFAMIDDIHKELSEHREKFNMVCVDRTKNFNHRTVLI